MLQEMGGIQNNNSKAHFSKKNETNLREFKKPKRVSEMKPDTQNAMTAMQTSCACMSTDLQSDGKRQNEFRHTFVATRPVCLPSFMPNLSTPVYGV